MNTRVLAILSLLVGIGAVLHAVVPPILFGMRPDIMLPMMFLGILLFPKLPYVFLLSIATGIISALTTTVPGGQISNIIDKPVTALIFFGLFLLVRKLDTKFTAPVLAAIGTVVSGTVFLSMALYVIGLLEAGFVALFATVVLPATLFNVIFIIVLYPVIKRIMNRAQPVAI
ncbi:tryptophan transporter [Sediminibacillus massiliensis]|uniref:tryptophan transporter n=1 Tax=Sediminibacillus massiliensis TaxID=1926277 RepID=UPI0009888417|nr:tryptophan transporter [Sediminibacillus massiliensis]